MSLKRTIERAGFKVTVMDANPYQHRVNGEVDIWINDRNRSLAWHDILTNERGRIPGDQVVFFLKNRIENRPTEVSKESFIETLVKDCEWSPEEAEREWNARQEKTA